ncbi:unnamed protein product [Penicillium pancosmium]
MSFVWSSTTAPWLKGQDMAGDMSIEGFHEATDHKYALQPTLYLSGVFGLTHMTPAISPCVHQITPI